MLTLICPYCNIRLFEHTANPCLSAWVATAIYNAKENFIGIWEVDGIPLNLFLDIPDTSSNGLPNFSGQLSHASYLLNYLFQKDFTLKIAVSSIYINLDNNQVPQYAIRGDTHAHRFCNAAIFLNFLTKDEAKGH